MRAVAVILATLLSISRANAISLPLSRSSSQNVTVESVTSLACADNAMTIRVNLTELRRLFSDTDPARISLADERCTGSVAGDMWVSDNPYSQCSTQRKIDTGFVTYSNTLIYKEHGLDPIIREHRWRVDLQCKFSRFMRITQGQGVDLSSGQNYEAALRSDFSATIRLYNDSTLRHQVTKAKLGDDLYVNIALNGQAYASMHVQRCVARPEPESDTSYTLIDNGCAIDTQTFFAYRTHNDTLFHFKAFEFYSGYSTVYVFCDLIYCAPSDVSSRCDVHCG